MLKQQTGKRVIRNLTPEEVLHYVDVNKRSSDLTKERNKLRDDLVLKLRGKHPDFKLVRFVSPAECEFILPLGYSKRSQMDWEEFSRQILLKAFKGDVDKVEKTMAKAVLDAGYKRFPVLQSPKPNINYLMQKRQQENQNAA